MSTTVTLRTAARLFLLVLALVSSGLAQSATEAPATCTFRAVQIQTGYTSVYGINNRGVIVGTYNSNSGTQWGYVLKDATVTNIAWPDAAFTSAYGMND